MIVGEILNSNHHYLIYIIGSMLFHWTYYIFHDVMKVVNAKYNQLSVDKQKYVASNFLKAIMLGGVTPFAGYVMYRGTIEDQWNNNLIRNLGVLYTIPDTVSLAVVNKMDLTTKIHHSVVCVFNIVSMQNDYTQDNVVRCMMIYACFSAYAFIVNFTLATRFLHDNKKLDQMLARYSFFIYSTCCFVNWSWHLKTLSNQWENCNDSYCSTFIPLYSAMIVAIVVDDVKLNNWLLNKSGLLTY